jgi:hypothetical protein
LVKVKLELLIFGSDEVQEYIGISSKETEDISDLIFVLAEIVFVENHTFLNWDTIFVSYLLSARGCFERFLLLH